MSASARRWVPSLFLVVAIVVGVLALRRSGESYRPPPRDASFWRHQVDSPADGTRATAIKYLGKFGTEDDLEVIRPILTEDPSGYVRAIAAESLGKLGCERAVPLLAAALDDPYQPVADEAVRSLAVIGGEAAFAHLAEAAQKGSQHRTAMIVAVALPRFQTRASEQLLIDLMNETDAVQIRWRTIRALKQVGTRTSVPELRKLVDNPFVGTEIGAAGVASPEGEVVVEVTGEIREVVDEILAEAITAASSRPPWPR